MYIFELVLFEKMVKAIAALTIIKNKSFQSKTPIPFTNFCRSSKPNPMIIAESIHIPVVLSKLKFQTDSTLNTKANIHNPSGTE